MKLPNEAAVIALTLLLGVCDQEEKEEQPSSWTLDHLVLADDGGLGSTTRPRRVGDPLWMRAYIALRNEEGDGAVLEVSSGPTVGQGFLLERVVLQSPDLVERPSEPIPSPGGPWGQGVPEGPPGTWRILRGAFSADDLPTRWDGAPIEAPAPTADGLIELPIAYGLTLEIDPWDQPPSRAWAPGRYRLESFQARESDIAAIAGPLLLEMSGDIWLDLLGEEQAPQLRVVIQQPAGPCAILWDDASWTGTALRWQPGTIGFTHPAYGPLELREPWIELAFAPGQDAPDGRAVIDIPEAVADLFAEDANLGSSACELVELVDRCTPCATGDGRCLHVGVGEVRLVPEALPEDPPMCGVDLLGDGSPADPWVVDVECGCGHRPAPGTPAALLLALALGRRRHRRARTVWDAQPGAQRRS